MLTINVSLEPPGAERTPRLRFKEVFREIIGVDVAGSTEETLRERLQVEVVNPCGAVFRKHVDKLRKRPGFTCLDSLIEAIHRDVSGGILAFFELSAEIERELHARRVKPSACQRRKAPSDRLLDDEPAHP